MFSKLAIYLRVAESLETLKGVLDICMGWHIMHRDRVYLYVLGPGKILFWYSKGTRCLSVWVALWIFFPFCYKVNSCTSGSFSQLPFCFLKCIQCHLSQKSTNQVIRRQYLSSPFCVVCFFQNLSKQQKA